jgi:uncharacterized protein YbgA (DUF1722 family)/uncharacterized protein YbbK (DUF523 family)
MSLEPKDPSIRIGISACLLGQKVRFDGGHKEDRFLTQTLGRYFEWVPVCPEVEVGLGTPRETLRLEDASGALRLIAPKSGTDHTEPMLAFAARRVAALSKENLSGFMLKKDSPSCGMERVRVVASSGMATRSGSGLFAAALQERFPALPIEEEGRMGDPKLRENWIERVFAYHELQALWASRWKIGDLVAFHTKYKLSLLAHSPDAYSRLGRIVGAASTIERNGLRSSYENEFMVALRKIATPGRHANVLQHMLGYFKEDLDDDARHELLGSIEDYRNGLVPRIVPITLILHYAKRLGMAYLLGQAYLNPRPKELLVRYHV